MLVAVLLFAVVAACLKFVPACGEGEGPPGSEPDRVESDHVEYLVRLLALYDAHEFWFVDLASISADPELAPLLQNLVDTWNLWNEDSSNELGLTLQDAAFAVSMPSVGVYLVGIEDVEGLRETMADLGYQRKETAGVVYWVHSSQE